MSDSERVDTALVRRGLSPSREKAQAMIMAGEVYVGERRINKSSEKISMDDPLRVRSASEKYVSRGAYKVEKAVKGEMLQSRTDTNAGIAATNAEPTTTNAGIAATNAKPTATV